jgi:hypothetical protein
MEAMAAMTFGLAGLTADVLALLLLRLKKPGFALVAGIVALAVTPLTLRFWRQALIQSGKSTALLGFAQYPAAGVLLGAVVLAAVILILVSISGLRKRRP